MLELMICRYICKHLMESSLTSFICEQLYNLRYFNEIITSVVYMAVLTLFTAAYTQE